MPVMALLEAMLSEEPAHEGGVSGRMHRLYGNDEYSTGTVEFGESDTGGQLSGVCLLLVAGQAGRMASTYFPAM